MSIRMFFGRHTAPVVVAFAVAAVVGAGVLVLFVSAGAKGAPPTGAQQQQDENPLIYKVKDSRSGFDGGHYKHVVDCPDGYKAISGGFDLNQRSDDPSWIIQSSRPGSSEEGQNDGQSWVTEAFWLKSSKGGPSNFKAFAVCAPQEFLPKVDYTFENHTVKGGSVETFWPQCKADERVIGGGFDLLGKQRLNLMRTERGNDGRSWGVGVWLDTSWPFSNAETQIRSYRVCVPAGALKDLDYKSARTTQKQRVAAYTPKCPEGTYLLSGGAGRPNEDTAPRWSRIAPGYDSNKNFTNNWGASAVHPTNELNTFTVFSFALCGRLADGDGQGAGARGGGGGDSPDKPGEPEN
jgi:hypothetical protein